MRIHHPWGELRLVPLVYVWGTHAEYCQELDGFWVLPGGQVVTALELHRICKRNGWRLDCDGLSLHSARQVVDADTKISDLAPWRGCSSLCFEGGMM